MIGETKPIGPYAEFRSVPLHRHRINIKDTGDFQEAHSRVRPALSQGGAPVGPVISHPKTPPAIQGDIGVPAVGTP